MVVAVVVCGTCALAGDVSFGTTLPVAVPADRFVTATATDPGGNTSEFSDTVRSTAAVVLSVSVSNPLFAFGSVSAGQWLSPDSSLIVNDGSVAEDFTGQISPFTDGTNTWAVDAASNGADSVRAQWSTTSNTGPWSDISAYDTDFGIATGVAADDTVTLWFRLQTPVTTSSYDEHASTLTITVTQN